MKAILIAAMLLLTTSLAAQYRENKKKFDYKTYSYQAGDRYNPTLAGAASFLVPGLGQIIVGETGRGLGFMGGYFLSYGLILGAASRISYEVYNSTEVTNNQTQVIVGLVGLLGTWIWSMGDAVRVAKVNNLAAREMNKKVSFSLQPIVLPQANTNHLAGGLQLNIRLD